jgi:outer membrane protein assembly factor BamB
VGLFAPVVSGSAFRGQTVPSQSNNPWPSYRHDSRNTGFGEGSAPDTNQTAWRSFVGEDAGTGPVVAYGNVFILGYKTNLTVLDDGDGTLVWTKNVPTWGSGPTIAYDMIYVGTLNGEVWALNRNTGDVVWKYPIYGYGVPLFNPQVADDRVFFNNRDGWLFCVNATTGEFIWKYETGLWVTYQAVADGRVFTVTSCLNETDGTLIWQYDAGRGSQSYLGPVVDNGRVFLSIGSAVHCLNEFNGSLMWTYETGGDVWEFPAVAYGKVFVSSHDGYLYCLNEEDGQFRWKSNVEFPDGYSASSPTVADNKVFVSVGQNLLCLDVNDGSLVWKYFAPHWLHPPIVAYGKVFVSWPGGVYAFGESTIPDIGFVSYSCPDTVLISGDTKSFEVTVNLENVGKVEAKNVRLEFQPSWGNVTFVSREVVDVLPDQTRSVSIKLNAINTGETHQADINLKIAYETPQGKTMIRDYSRAIGPPSFFITIVPVPPQPFDPPPFLTTPFGLAALIIVAFLVGVAITTIIFKRKKSGESRMERAQDMEDSKLMVYARFFSERDLRVGNFVYL